jgi:hypothetical protein
MKKALLMVSMLLLVCGSVFARGKKVKLSPADLQKRQAVMASPDHEIVPGRRIGPIRLGMGQDQVLAILGQPDYAVPFNRGEYPKYVYESLNLLIYFSPDATPSVRAVQAKGWRKNSKTLGQTYWGKNIEPIQTNWSTSTGVTLGSTSFDVQRAYSTFTHQDSEVSMSYDALKISFVITMDHMVDTIIVSAPQ